MQKQKNKKQNIRIFPKKVYLYALNIIVFFFILAKFSVEFRGCVSDGFMRKKNRKESAISRV